MEYIDTRTKHATAWMQEIADELTRRGASMDKALEYGYLWGNLTGKFRNGSLNLSLNKAHDLMRVTWGPCYLRAKHRQPGFWEMSIIRVGAQTYNALWTKLERATRKLPPNTIAGQAAIEALIVDEWDKPSRSGAYSQVEHACKRVNPGGQAAYYMLNFEVTQGMVDLIAKKDTIEAMELKSKYP